MQGGGIEEEGGVDTAPIVKPAVGLGIGEDAAVLAVVQVEGKDAGVEAVRLVGADGVEADNGVVLMDCKASYDD